MNATVNAPRRRRSRGPRLAPRLAIQLFILAVVITAAAAWLAIALVRSTLEDRINDELRRMQARVSVELERLERELHRSLADLEEHLRTREPDLLERLLLNAPGLEASADRLLPLARLDWLEFVDPQRGVISSAPWRERAGLAVVGDPAGVYGREGTVSMRRLGDASGGRLGLLCHRRVTVGSRVLLLVGGRELDTAFLDRVAGSSGGAMLYEGPGSVPLLSTGAAAFDLRSVAAELGRSPRPGELLKLADVDGAPRDALHHPLTDAAGQELGQVIVAVDRRSFEPIMKRMRNGFLLLGGAAGLIAALAGVWIARSISRPVRELVQAFDAVAAGEADYSFPAPRQDELQELIAAVSRLKRALELQQQRSSAAERVATWRDVARHVAHEVKNPLVPIRLTVENLVRARQRAPERFDSIFTDGMRTIIEEVDQLRRMVEEFSAFARLPLPTRQSRDLERLIDSVLDLYESVPGLQIQRQYGGGLSAVPLDADQISRALKNIVGNAVEILRERGAGAGEPPRIEVRTGVEDEMACIEVADNGPGMSEEAERRIFEPYFTTKQQGTGLGMALTYRIIIEHGGMISAENRSAGGARVKIRLPLSLELPVTRPADRAH